MLIQKNKKIVLIWMMAAAFACVSCSQNKRGDYFADGNYTFEAKAKRYEEEGVIRRIGHLCWKDNKVYMAAGMVKKDDETGLEQPILLSCDKDGNNSEILDLSLDAADMVKGLSADKKGRLYVLIYNSESKFVVKVFDKKGKLDDSWELQNDSESLYPNVNRNMFITKDGSVLGIQNNQALIFGSDGERLSAISFSADYIDIDFFQQDNGKVYAAQMQADGAILLAEIDMEEGKFGENITVNSDIQMNNVRFCAGSRDTVYIANDITNVYSVNIFDGTVKELFSWEQAGTTMTYIEEMVFRDGRFYAANVTFGDNSIVSELIVVNSEKTDSKQE